MKLIHLRFVIAILSVLIFAGCARQQVYQKSSVMDYLYPKTNNEYPEASRPQLQIPLRVGVAFAPDSQRSYSSFHFFSGAMEGPQFSETLKDSILRNVADNFEQHEFVEKIEIIPSAYLSDGGSFTNLQQIKSMFGIDIIALVSYDQTQFTDDDALSLSYWTIVGAYIVAGSKNDTHTLIDTVVYDIDSKNLLFRAPGKSMVKGRSTPVNLGEELRTDSAQGLNLAANEMIENLDNELIRFTESVKENREDVQIDYRKGYAGGSVGVTSLLFLFIVFIRKFKRIALVGILKGRNYA